MATSLNFAANLHTLVLNYVFYQYADMQKDKCKNNLTGHDCRLTNENLKNSQELILKVL